MSRATRILRAIVVRPPRGQPRHVVIGPRPRRPRSGGQPCFGVPHDAQHGVGVERGREKGEVEGQVQFVAPVAVVADQRFDLDRGLADQDPGSVIGVSHPPPAPDDIVDLRPVGVVHGTLAEKLCIEVVGLVRRRIVPQQRVLDDDVAHVDPESGHATVEPEPEDGVERHPDLFVPPVEIRLLGEVIVQVVLGCDRVQGPRRPSEAAHPIVRGAPSGPGSAHTYQSRLAADNEERESTNQGC